MTVRASHALPPIAQLFAEALDAATMRASHAGARGTDRLGGEPHAERAADPMAERAKARAQYALYDALMRSAPR